MKKKSLLVLIILLVSIALFFIMRSAFNYYTFLKQPIFPLTHAAPAETVVIVRGNSIAEFVEKARSSGMGELLQASGTSLSFNAMAAFADSLMQRDIVLQEILEENPFILTVVPGKDGFPEMLISIQIKGKSLRSIQKRIMAVMSHDDISIIKDLKGYSDISQMSKGSQAVWYYLHNGIFTLGFNPALVSLSRKALDGDHPLTLDTGFARLEEASGKKVDAVLFVRNDFLLQHLARPDEMKVPGMDEIFNSWSALDMHIGKDKIMLSGFTLGRNKNWMANQSPVKSKQTGVMPGEYAMAYTLSIDQPDKFFTDKGIGDTLHIIQKGKGSLLTSANIFRLKDHLTSWIGGNVGLLTDVKHGKEKSSLIFMDSRNADSARIALSSFINFSATPLPKIRTRGIFDRLFGEYFVQADSAYCLFTPGRLLISTSADLLSNYAELLSKPLEAKQHQVPMELLNDRGNLLLYFSAEDIYAGLKAAAGNQTLSKGVSWGRFLQACDHLVLQYSGGDEMVYTQGSLVFNPLAQSGQLVFDSLAKPVLEAIAMDTAAQNIIPETEMAEEKPELPTTPLMEVAHTPVVLSGQKGGQKVVAITDNQKVALFDDKGKQMWHFNCNGTPSGDIFEVILPESGKRNYVVVTDSHLHLLTLDGKEIKSSPFKLPGGNAGHASLFDYDRKRDYRILYPGKDGKVYNVTLQGQELPDWSKPVVGNLAVKPMFWRTTGKDYLLFTNGEGKLSITDRRGRTRISISDVFRQSVKAEVFENKTNSKGLFITSSKDGKLAYITADGLVSYSEFGNFGSNPWFFYADFDNDNSLDFLFAGNGKIGIYSRMKKEIISYHRKGADYGEPFIYSPSSGDQWVATREKSSGDIIFFRNKINKVSVMKLRSQSDPLIFNPGGRKPEIMVTISNGKPVFTEIK